MTLDELELTKNLVTNLKTLRDGAEELHFRLLEIKEDINKKEDNAHRCGILKPAFLGDLVNQSEDHVGDAVDYLNKALAKVDRVYRYGLHAKGEGEIALPPNGLPKED